MTSSNVFLLAYLSMLEARETQTHRPLKKQPHKHRLSALLIVLVIFVSGWGAPFDATAQPGPERTLRIQNDTVYIDGVEVSQEALPDELVLDGMQMQYQVYGIEMPTVQIRGHIYRLTESTLEPVSQVRSNEAGALGRQDTATRTRASEKSTPEGTTPDSTTLETTVSDYLRLLQAQSQALYEAVQREYTLEQAAEQRAYRIHQLDPGPERTAHLDTLRQTVSRLFDLKQANRRREIAQLERQVESMRERMQERAAHREAMIEQRIQHLIGFYHEETGRPTE